MKLKTSTLTFKTTDDTNATTKLESTNNERNIHYKTYSRSTKECIVCSVLDCEGIDGRLREKLVAHDDLQREHGRKLQDYNPSVVIIHKSSDADGRDVISHCRIELRKNVLDAWKEMHKHGDVVYHHRELLTIESHIDGASYCNHRIIMSDYDVFEVECSGCFRQVVLMEAKSKFEEVCMLITEALTSGVIPDVLKKPIVVKIDMKHSYCGNRIKGRITFSFKCPDTPLAFSKAREVWFELHKQHEVRLMGTTSEASENDESEQVNFNPQELW